uniref:Peptidase C1A papain C-terminal domain-containing protein n=1 Tax=Tetradesmus obliquus TaxID=3088 RepID=A0A383WKQ7_TETOB|eukprot:jgi/Sobl393_1/3893/SZX78047.1
MPASYSSNNTRDTPGRLPYISPAQDQGLCASCVGFAVTAAAEAVINVQRQQSWRNFNLSEQDLSFCKLQPRVSCTTGASYDGVISSFLNNGVSSWAARSCWSYTGNANKGCPNANTCSNQLSNDASLSWAYNANALDSMAKVKERVMLSGGVIASMAMSDAAFQQFQAYGAEGDAVFAPPDDLASADTVTMHAIFCYGWWDNATNAEDGWWLCKNSWGPSWGLNGSFKVAYGAAYIMQPDYTFAFRVSESVPQVQQRFAQAFIYPAKPGCLQYSPQQPQRLITLADDLITLTALAPEFGLTPGQVLADVVTSNLGGNLPRASRGPFRLCSNYIRPLVRKVACLSPPQQPPDARPWSGCRPAVGSICIARCTPGGLRGYRAVCSLTNGIATWRVTAGCSAGPLVVLAEPPLCVTTTTLVLHRSGEVELAACRGLSDLAQEFKYKEGRIQLVAASAWCLGTSGSTGDGSEVKLRRCDQLKSLLRADFVPYLEERAGVVALKSNTSLCIAAPVVNPGRGDQVELQPCSSKNASFVYKPDGTLQWEETNKCLDVFSFLREDGAQVVEWTCNESSLVATTFLRDGALRPLFALDHCLGVPEGNVKPGTPVQLWKCNQSKAQLFAADWMPSVPAAAYLGCFRSKASASVLPDLLSEDLPGSNTTDQCRKFAAGSLVEKFWKPAQDAVHPLFGVSGRKCFGGRNLTQATALGPAPESDCAANKADVVALYQMVQPGGPIPRGCVTDEKAFLKGLPVEESVGKAIRDATPASYAIAKAFAKMKGAKYFAVSGAAKEDWGYTFGAEPTTAPLLNVTVSGSLGCFTPCADDASKSCGNADRSGGATSPRVWFVYEFPP